MSSGPIILTLTTWAQQRLTALFQANKQAAFDAAFDAFVSKNAQITVNGAKLSRADYKTQLQGSIFAEASATVSFSGAVEVPTNKGKPVETGSVGLFLNATINERILVHDTPVQRKITSSFNLAIDQDSSVSGEGPVTDNRRVQVLNQVVVEQAVPIHFSPVAGSGSA